MSETKPAPPPEPPRRLLTAPVVRSALIVALVVGSLLNLINQGDALWSETPVDWLKLGLTYCVPFFVSLYGSYSALRLSRKSPG